MSEENEKNVDESESEKVESKASEKFSYSKANGEISNRKGDYTVEVNKSINEMTEDTVITTNIDEKLKNKKKTENRSEYILEKYSDGAGYFKKTQTSEIYEDKKILHTVDTEKRQYASDAIQKAKGYNDNSETIHVTDKLYRKDKNGDLASYNIHQSIISSRNAQRSDAYVTMQADAKHKADMDANAYKDVSDTGIPGAVIHSFEKDKNLEIKKDGDGIRYKTMDLRTGNNTYVLQETKGSLSGFEYNEDKNFSRDLSDKELRSIIKKSQKAAQKILQQVTRRKDIKTIDDYYNLLPDVNKTDTMSPNEYFRKGDEAAYQQARSSIAAENKPRIEENKALTPEILVEMRKQQYLKR